LKQNHSKTNLSLLRVFKVARLLALGIVLTLAFPLSKVFSEESLTSELFNKLEAENKPIEINSENLAQYEKSYGFKQHDHAVCIETGQVFEFCDPRIQQIKETVSQMLEFDITHHSLTFYGYSKEGREKKK
jgi:Fe2+ or Zn2+ uptake regulation protein